MAIMHSYSSPSRKKLVHQKLDALDSGHYQVLGVRFVCLIQNGESIEWMAVNEDGTPGQGHPDGRIRLMANRFIDVEVSKAAIWSRKILDDLEAIAPTWNMRTQKPDRLILVTSHIKDLKGGENERRTSDEEQKIRKKAQELLCITPEKITFIHLNELVERLAEQTFAQFVRQWLNVPFDPRPFRTVSDEIKIIHGAKQEGIAWIPPLQDYYTGRVQVPERDLEQVKQLLAEHREFTVWGRGAAGKTTFALLLGIEAEKDDRTALYLDLLRESSMAPHEIVDALAQHTDERSLVIFDNLHLYDHTWFKELRREIAVRRAEGSLPNFAVLCVGRDTSVVRRRISRSKERKAQRVDRAIGMEPELLLEVDAEALRCVFSRFEAQFTARTRRTLSSDTKASWCTDPSYFGNDLVAFSIALYRNLDQLDIKPGGIDAVHDFLRAHYLDPYSDDECGRFIRLCALAQFDVEVSAKALSGSSARVFQEKGQDKNGRAVANLVARGVVFERDMGAYGFRYGLVHSSFAQLILNAVRGKGPDIFETIKEYVKKDPHLVAPFLRGLAREDYHGEILTKVGDWLVAERDILASALFQTPAQFWYWMVRLLPNRIMRGDQDTVPAWRSALEIVCDHQYRSLRESWARSTQLHFLVHWFRQFRSQPGSSSLIDVAGPIILNYLVSDEEAFTHQVIRAPFDSLTTFLQYLDQRPATDTASQAAATAVHQILATTDLTPQVIRAPFDSLTTFLQYLDQRPATDTASQATATAVCQILATTELTPQVIRAPFDHLMPFIEYLDERPSDERRSHKVATTIREALTEKRLEEKMIGAKFSELTGMLNSVRLCSQAQPDDPAVSSLHERVTAVLRSSAMQKEVVSRLMHGASLSHLRDLLVAIKAFHSTAWEAILRHTVTSVGVGALTQRLKPPCSLKDATTFLGVFEGYNENRLLKELTQFLLATPEELARRSSREGLEPVTHLLFRARHNEIGEISGFIKDLSQTAIFKTFYGPGGPGPTALFLWSAWRIFGASPEFDGLWDNKLVKIGHYGLCKWNVNPEPEMLLGRTLQLWGMIMRFSGDVPRLDPSRLPAILLPDQETCDTVLSLQELHDFAPTTTCVLGLEALRLSISAEIAQVTKERLVDAQTEIESSNLFIGQLVNQAISWLIKHEG